MPTIKISNLHPAGSELFSDFESYMNELGDSELDIISGGTGTPLRSSMPCLKNASRVATDVSRYITQQELQLPTAGVICGAVSIG
jgi:hypothetical protein